MQSIAHVAFLHLYLSMTQWKFDVEHKNFLNVHLFSRSGTWTTQEEKQEGRELKGQNMGIST